MERNVLKSYYSERQETVGLIEIEYLCSQSEIDELLKHWDKAIKRKKKYKTDVRMKITFDSGYQSLTITTASVGEA